MNSSLSLRVLRTTRITNKKIGLLTFVPFCSTNYNPKQPRTFRTANSKMSSGFSNADTGSKPADPYKSKNIDHVSIKEKVEDLSDFITACKFGMMTTRDSSNGMLFSRCMALAAKVCFYTASPLHLKRTKYGLSFCFNGIAYLLTPLQH